jgi:hypothetical protein
MRQLISRVLALLLTMAPVLSPLLVGGGLYLGGKALGRGIALGGGAVGRAMILQPKAQAEAQFDYNVRVFEFQKAQFEAALREARPGEKS